VTRVHSEEAVDLIQSESDLDSLFLWSADLTPQFGLEPLPQLLRITGRQVEQQRDLAV
jgi:hypothetical protein